MERTANHAARDLTISFLGLSERKLECARRVAVESSVEPFDAADQRLGDLDLGKLPLL